MAFSKSIEELIQEDTSGLLSKHDSWERVLLSDIAKVLNGYAFPSSYFNSAGKGLPLIRIRDVISGKTETFYSGPFENEYLVADGDLLIGMDGDFNSSYWCGGKALLNQRVCKISVFSNHYHKKFLGYLLPNYLNAINQNTSSTTVKHLSSATISNILLPLPPENEQVRIVEKLDTLLSDLDQGVAELKTAQEKLTQYRQTLLKSAVEGTLTKEWREEHAYKITETGEQLLARILKERRALWEKQKLEEFAKKGQTPPKDWQKKYPEPVVPDTSGLPKLPDGWVWASVDQISAYITSGSRGWAKFYANNGAVFIRAQNIKTDKLVLDDVAFVNINASSEGIRTKVEINDLLLTITGANVGKCAQVKIKLEEAYVNQHIALIRPLRAELSSYIHLNLVDECGVRKRLDKLAYGAGKPGLNLVHVASAAIPLPNLEEIEIIVSKVMQAEVDIESQSNHYDLAIEQFEVQRKNILKEAFLGKLVEQNQNDEPVLVLLEKIKIEREARDKLPKPKNPKKIKEKSNSMKTLSEILKANGDWMDAQEAFAACGVGNGTDTDRIEELYAELRRLDKAGQLLTKRQGHYDMIKLKDI